MLAVVSCTPWSLLIGERTECIPKQNANDTSPNIPSAVVLFLKLVPLVWKEGLNECTDATYRQQHTSAGGPAAAIPLIGSALTDR